MKYKKSSDEKLQTGSATAGHGDERGHFSKETKTIGWQPLCDCFVRKNSGFFLQNKIARPIVLDPFIGSGTVAEVCERYGRAWIGIELSQEYCDIAVKRIEKEARQMKLEIS